MQRNEPTLRAASGAIFVAAMLCVSAVPVSAASRPVRSVAVTFDDLTELTADEDTVPQQQAITAGILGVIRREHVPAAGFVNEDKLLDENERPDPRLTELLERWLEAGCELGNHTYSHLGLSDVGAAAFEQDVVRGERIILPMMAAHHQAATWFRHPYLDTGNTKAEREEVDRFLEGRGYRVAPVTIDDSEWIYDLAYRRASIAVRPFIARSYVRYMRARVEFAEMQSRRVFGHEIPQVLLLHASALNADHFDALVAMMRKRGYRFISLGEAMADPAYATKESWTGGGVGWLERWGVARGLSQASFEHDPKVPPWIQRLGKAKDQ